MDEDSDDERTRDEWASILGDLLCRYCVKGWCKYGDRCRFLHAGFLPKQEQPVCTYFQQGKCW